MPVVSEEGSLSLHILLIERAGEEINWTAAAMRTQTFDLVVIRSHCHYFITLNELKQTNLQDPHLRREKNY